MPSFAIRTLVALSVLTATNLAEQWFGFLPHSSNYPKKSKIKRISKIAYCKIISSRTLQTRRDFECTKATDGDNYPCRLLSLLLSWRDPVDPLGPVHWSRPCYTSTTQSDGCLDPYFSHYLPERAQRTTNQSSCGHARNISQLTFIVTFNSTDLGPGQ